MSQLVRLLNMVSKTGVDSKYVGSRLGEGTKEGLYMLGFPQEGENNGIGDTFAANIPFQSSRRSGSVWYAAAVNGTKEKLKQELDLSFIFGENVKLYFDKKERFV